MPVLGKGVVAAHAHMPRPAGTRTSRGRTAAAFPVAGARDRSARASARRTCGGRGQETPAGAALFEAWGRRHGTGEFSSTSFPSERVKYGLGTQEDLSRGPINRRTAVNLDAFDVLDLDAKDDQVRGNVLGQVLVHQQLLVRAGPAESIVEHFRIEQLPDSLAEPLLVGEAVAGGEGIAEEEDPRLVALLLREVNVRSEPLGVRADEVAAPFGRYPCRLVGNVEVPDDRIVPHEHPVGALRLEGTWRRLAN